ncbi:MAG TPA: PepSY domain-containing protein [Methylotenera sp.]|nr:PepSY domain-containing protein [Methylotenera sp.]HPH08399.1 PepSY domain-containing protein [Methylotenera sp.]HPM48673.1 PepSY domain-containing protein [Methylotenera sp.]
MNKKNLLVALATMFVSTLAYAGQTHSGKMETCMKAALAKHPGEVLTIEAEISGGKAQYEFDIKDKDGKEWEVECLAKSGKVIEEEQELANADDPAFKAKAKITQEDAKKTALAKYPGDVVDSEVSIEADGSASYEFDIKTANGKEMEVEVDATTGKLSEDPEEEIYQIGVEQ